MLRTKDPTVRELVSANLTSERFNAIKATLTGNQLDEWVAAQIQTCLEPSNPDSAAFIKYVGNHDITSGAEMLWYIRSDAWRGFISPEEIKALEKAFEGSISMHSWLSVKINIFRILQQ